MNLLEAIDLAFHMFCLCLSIVVSVVGILFSQHVIEKPMHQNLWSAAVQYPPSNAHFFCIGLFFVVVIFPASSYIFPLKFEDITKLLSLKLFGCKIIKIIPFVLMQKSYFAIMHKPNCYYVNNRVEMVIGIFLLV